MSAHGRIETELGILDPRTSDLLTTRWRKNANNSCFGCAV